MVGSQSTLEREAGFLDGLAKYPHLKILSSDQFSGDTPQSALDKAQQMLGKYGDEIDALFAVCEPNTAGTLKALEETGQAGKIVFIGFDPNERIVQALAENKVQGVVLQEPGSDGLSGGQSDGRASQRPGGRKADQHRRGDCHARKYERAGDQTAAGPHPVPKLSRASRSMSRLTSPQSADPPRIGPTGPAPRRRSLARVAGLGRGLSRGGRHSVAFERTGRSLAVDLVPRWSAWRVDIGLLAAAGAWLNRRGHAVGAIIGPLLALLVIILLFAAADWLVNGERASFWSMRTCAPRPCKRRPSPWPPWE